jgi:hypothetical protein
LVAGADHGNPLLRECIGQFMHLCNNGGRIVSTTDGIVID